MDGASPEVQPPQPSGVGGEAGRSVLGGEEGPLRAVIAVAPSEADAAGGYAAQPRPHDIIYLMRFERRLVRDAEREVYQRRVL